MRHIKESHSCYFNFNIIHYLYLLSPLNGYDYILTDTYKIHNNRFTIAEILEIIIEFTDVRNLYIITENIQYLNFKLYWLCLLKGQNNG